MPNIRQDQAVFIDAGDPDKMNCLTLNRPGELGMCFEWNQRSYQIVQLDSGATSATTAGAVAANELAYWKDRTTYLVTNDSRQALYANTALSFRNRVAGIFRASTSGTTTATPGYYICILQRGDNIAVKEVGSATCGMVLIASTSTTAADALGVAINTAPNCLTLGTVRTATSGVTCYADVNIADVP